MAKQRTKILEEDVDQKGISRSHDQSQTNAVTPITHLFLKTVQTNRSVSINCDEGTTELHLTCKGREKLSFILNESEMWG